MPAGPVPITHTSKVPAKRPRSVSRASTSMIGQRLQIPGGQDPAVHEKALAAAPDVEAGERISGKAGGGRIGKRGKRGKKPRRDEAEQEISPVWHAGAPESPHPRAVVCEFTHIRFAGRQEFDRS